MELDNFKLITPFLDFPNKDTFYFLQIIKRRKENPEMKTGNKVIKSYYLRNDKDLNKLKSNIIDYCVFNNARAYIRLNKRSKRKQALQCLKRITELVISEDYDAVSNVFEHIAGEFHSDPVKKWIIDFDKDNVPNLTEVVQAYKEELKDFILVEVPTFNGIHLITKTFNLNNYSNKKHPITGEPFKSSLIDCRNAVILKDNPTILFASKLDENKDED